MVLTTTSCYKCVGGTISCACCEGNLIKYGRDIRGKQRYFCKKCIKTTVVFYTYQAYHIGTNPNIIALTKEGVGILSMARLLSISATTILKRIKNIASTLFPPTLSDNQEYEVDELKTYYLQKSNPIWIAYALERESRRVVSFAVGSRSNAMLNQVLQPLVEAYPRKIYTDKLKSYKYLIDNKIHSIQNRSTNHIERMNLTLRTHLKRLNRRTLSFSKCVIMLESIIRIYFWSKYVFGANKLSRSVSITLFSQQK
ncbi:IS1 family transposase [Flectobacillus longus]|nr:IS1 family transposase [Flectobacillus longus]MDI9882796.1 IS1 family transposase [Flectobacillus longus]